MPWSCGSVASWAVRFDVEYLGNRIVRIRGGERLRVDPGSIEGEAVSLSDSLADAVSVVCADLGVPPPSRPAVIILALGDQLFRVTVFEQPASAPDDVATSPPPWISPRCAAIP